MLHILGKYYMKRAIGPRSSEYIEKNEYDVFIKFAGSHVVFNFQVIAILWAITAAFGIYKDLNLDYLFKILLSFLIIIIPVNYFGQIKQNMIHIESYILNEKVSTKTISKPKLHFFTHMQTIKVEYIYNNHIYNAKIIFDVDKFEYFRKNDEIILFINKYYFPNYVNRSHNKSALYRAFVSFYVNYHKMNGI